MITFPLLNDLAVILGSLFNALGFAVGVALYWYEAKRRKLATAGMTRILVVGAIFGVLAARIVERLAEGAPMGSLFDPLNGGRTIIGGVIGGWLFVEIAKRRMGIRVSTGPLWAVALPAGEAFGRIGCLISGCCYGKKCDLPWAIPMHGEMRHPSQIYLAVSAALIFVIVWIMRDKTRVFPLYLALWSASRFTIEFFREPVTPTNGLSTAQYACLGVFAVAVYLFKKPILEQAHE